MKSPYVSELQPNQLVTATFLVQSKDVRQKKTGEPYLSLVLGDRTGDIDAKMWDNVGEVVETFERDDFIRVKGLLQIYQNKPQLTIHKMVKVTEDDIDPADYFPASLRDPDEMLAELHQIIGGFTNPHLKALLEAIFRDEDVARRYKRAPAAKAIHHAYLGGLIEHVLSLCHLGRLMAAHYKHIDLDLLLTGIILHDIGKVSELTYDRSFAYSNDGQLLGHIVIALRMVGDKLRDMPQFPARLRSLVEHMIVSHHGELEFGSPKVPLFPEALLLHHLDNLDSKMECMRMLIEKDKQVDGFWTSYSPALERPALKKDKYLDDRPAAPSPTSVPATAPQQREAAAAPQQRPAPRYDRGPSLFGEKLSSALKGDG
ncbi:MAG: 3'-5' exoribonuclease YhaM family protein [Bryobacteraceae bacterium]